MMYDQFFDTLLNSQLEGWIDVMRPHTDRMMRPDSHGKMPNWLDAIRALPQLTPDAIDLLNAVRVAGDIDATMRQHLITQLMQLHPWRKGPFDLYGIEIDTEWRSDWKWDRVKDHVDLAGKRVLDVGCGNGYHGWRMMGAGAKEVIGLDPFLLYVMQFHAISRLIPRPESFAVLPVGIEMIPEASHAFDTVFSMGVLYHRRSPFDHLITLRDTLKSGGEMILETLVIDGQMGEVLVPEGRYAKMRNVWFIPSVLTLESWLKKSQFKGIELLDVTPTTTDEQRSTEWMTFHSLADFLHVEGKRTVENHPLPIRAVFKAAVP